MDPLKEDDGGFVYLLDLWLAYFASFRLSEVFGVNRKKAFLRSSNEADDLVNILRSFNL